MAGVVLLFRLLVDYEKQITLKSGLCQGIKDDTGLWNMVLITAELYCPLFQNELNQVSNRGRIILHERVDSPEGLKDRPAGDLCAEHEASGAQYCYPG